MSILDQILGPLEIGLNRALGSSPSALQTLRESHGALALQFRDLGWGFRLAPTVHGLQLLPGTEGARAGVSTSLVGLARLMAGEDPREMGDALRLEGDAEYAEQIMAAIRSARFDLESEISSLLGPVLGSRLGQGVKDALDFGRQSLRSLLLGDRGTQTGPDSGDAQLADPQATREWMDAVDDTAAALDRIEARIARLERQHSE